MAYHFDSYDNSLVIDGFEKGIADSPFSGIADMRCANVVSIPGEASVNFATSVITPPAITGNVTSANAAADTITYTNIPNVEPGMAIVFSATTIGGLSTGTVYWLGFTGTTSSQLFSDYKLSNLVDITLNGTGTFTTYTIAQPRYLTSTNSLGTWVIDSVGHVWSNINTTAPSGFWTFTGNIGGNGLQNGNGITSYVASDGTVYIFAFRNSCIDYVKNPGLGTAWTYGWKPADATTGNGAGYLKTTNGINNPHEAFVAPDNRVYYCDNNWIGRWYETTPTTPFDPTNLASYTFDQTSLLPSTDRANCLAFLGTNILVGGKYNVIYPWDRFSTNFSYPILLAENNITKMVTINTNTFIFVGNRGRIYYTNGTNVNLYKKVPDHISGTVEPYFTWGGATSVKNQLYFSCLVTTNGGTAVNQYGGLWAIDVDTEALRLVNKLSYGTYAGYAPAIIPNFAANAAGTGLYIGWDDGTSHYGIDTTTSAPYTGSQTTIDSDLIPIGTFSKPRDLTKLEYRLVRPLVAGESITVKTRLIFNTQDTGYSNGTIIDSTVGHYSNIADVDFLNAQWVQFQIVLNSTASSPSYTRLKELRVLGLVGPTLAQNQTLSL